MKNTHIKVSINMSKTLKELKGNSSEMNITNKRSAAYLRKEERSESEEGQTYMMPAALSSLFFWSMARRRASSSCLSRALRLAFLPWVFARRARASDNISFSA